MESGSPCRNNIRYIQSLNTRAGGVILVLSLKWGKERKKSEGRLQVLAGLGRSFCR